MTTTPARSSSSLLDSAEGRRVMRDHRIAEDALVVFRRMLAEGGSISTTLSINGKTTALPVPLSIPEAHAILDVWQAAHRRQYVADVERIIADMRRQS